MKVVGISAANIRHQKRGTSVKLLEMVFKHLQNMDQRISSSLIPLVDLEIQPCIGCGSCAFSHECNQFNDDFNSIYQQLVAADALVIAAAHYAPIPAKLCALFERIESIAFLGQFNSDDFTSPLRGKPYAVVGHAGGPPEIWNSYYDVIFAPIKNALAFPVSMKPVSTGEWAEIGVMVGPSRIEKDPASVFPVQIYDKQLLADKTKLVAQALLRQLQDS